MDYVNKTLTFLTVVPTTSGGTTTVTTTVLKTAAGGDLSLALPTLAQGTIYRWRFQFMQSRFRGKVWAAAEAEPANWMLEGYSNALMTAGKVGVGNNLGYVKVAELGFSGNLLPAPVA